MLPRLLVAVVFLLLAAADTALAQSAGDDWPADLDRLLNYNDPAKFPRGPGGYIGIFKLAMCWLVFLGWVRSSDWINVDAIQTKGSYWRWNSIAAVTFVAAVALIWALNLSIFLSLPLLLVAWIAPLALYVRQRNANPEIDERVFTPEHLRVWAAPRLAKVGIKIASEKKVARKNAPPPIDYKAQGAATEPLNQGNLLKAKQMAGFNPTGELLLDALSKRAGAVMMDFTREAVGIRYQIDSVWIDIGPRDRATGDSILEVIKTLAALKPEERAARQKGSFGIQKEKAKWQCRVVTMGTKTGERAVVQIDDGKARKAKLTDIGMREKLQNDLKAVLGEKKGFVLISAPPRGGLSTLLAATAGAVDRFMRSALALEDSTNKDLEVENIPIKTYGGPGEEKALTVLAELIRQYPDVIVVPDLNDPQIVVQLCEQVSVEERLVIGGIRAREAVEAMLRVLMLKVPIKSFVPVVTAVVNQRLVRKLCETCKEAYTPTPQMLQQLRLPADQVTSFYRPPQPVPGEKPKPPCPDCGGSGYRGVTGMFELIVVNDVVRAAFAKQPTLESVRQAAQKAGMRTLQEEGILLVAQGVTSLPELKRALTEKD
jgi:type II secretory ATPase GspE/PulE/Tfp pilus assembly ATPase PilB-like protein